MATKPMRKRAAGNVRAEATERRETGDASHWSSPAGRRMPTLRTARRLRRSLIPVRAGGDRFGAAADVPDPVCLRDDRLPPDEFDGETGSSCGRARGNHRRGEYQVAAPDDRGAHPGSRRPRSLCAAESSAEITRNPADRLIGRHSRPPDGRPPTDGARRRQDGLSQAAQFSATRFGRKLQILAQLLVGDVRIDHLVEIRRKELIFATGSLDGVPISVRALAVIDVAGLRLAVS